MNENVLPLIAFVSKEPPVDTENGIDAENLVRAYLVGVFNSVNASLSLENESLELLEAFYSAHESGLDAVADYWPATGESA